MEAKSDYESKLINNYASINNNLIYVLIFILSFKKWWLTTTDAFKSDTATCDQDKARLFNSYFYSVFTVSRVLAMGPAQKFL